MKLLTQAFLAASLLAASGTAAMAAQCSDRTHVVTELKSRLGQVLAYSGMGRDRHIVEVYASPKSERWTMTVATPDGLSCVLATGRGANSLSQRLGQTVVLAGI